MGLMSFIKEAGEKLFGGSEAKAAQAAVQAAPTPEAVAAMSRAAGAACDLPDLSSARVTLQSSA